MQLPISLGNQGFASLRENHCFYIDKQILSENGGKNRML